MKPPLVNAVLTSIAGGGLSEDYDSPAGADTARWSGRADGYLDEVLRENVGPNGLDQVAATRLVVPYEQGSQVQRGDTVTYSHAGTSRSRTARNVQPFKLFGTVVVWMWDQ